MPSLIGLPTRSSTRETCSPAGPIKLVEDAETAEVFVANALAPAAVYNVTISENDDRVAYVEVDDADRGAAIGDGGKNIDAARLLASRHFGVDDVELT